MPKRLTTEEFISRSQEVHKGKYDYSKSEYLNNRTKVKIICPIHGEFQQRPFAHMQGLECYKCGKEKTSQTMKKSPELFLQDCNSIHGNKYSYDNCKYIRSTQQITVTCPVHGDFCIRASNHLRGQGCNDCILSSYGWSFTNWEIRANQSSHFDSFKVYKARLFSDTESFFKIGKTFLKTKRRFQSIKSESNNAYDYEIIEEIKGNARDISVLELELHYSLKEYKYKPSIWFGGQNECFSKVI